MARELLLTYAELDSKHPLRGLLRPPPHPAEAPTPSSRAQPFDLWPHDREWRLLPIWRVLLVLILRCGDGGLCSVALALPLKPRQLLDSASAVGTSSSA